jgi:hypothetical protein
VGKRNKNRKKGGRKMPGYVGGRAAIRGHGVCQYGRCVVMGERCEPFGYCPAHCTEHHAAEEHPKAGEFTLRPATLVVEERF